MKYAREDFKPVPGVSGQFYCPGCNATNDDYAIPSIGCPCQHFGSASGSLHADGVKAYLWVEARSDFQFQFDRAEEEHRLREDAEKREAELRRGVHDSGAARRPVEDRVDDRLRRVLAVIDYGIYGGRDGQTMPSICSKLHVAHMDANMIVTPEGRSIDCPICCPSLPELVDGHLHYRKLARQEVEGYREAIARFRQRRFGGTDYVDWVELMDDFLAEVDMIDKVKEAGGE